MAISRMQEPRQLYGLGSLVKSIGKTIKKVVKSPIGKAALLVGGAGLAGFGPAKGLRTSGLGNFLFGGATKMLPANAIKGAAVTRPGIFGAAKKVLGSTLGQVGIGAALSALAASGMDQEEIAEIENDPDKLNMYLKDYYSKTNPDASGAEIEEFVRINSAVGGRVGLEKGGSAFEEYKQDLEDGIISPDTTFNEWLDNNAPDPDYDKSYAIGGRVGFADGKNMKMASMEENEIELMRLVEEFMERGFSQQEAIEEAKDTLERKSIAIGGRVGLEAGANKDFQEYLKGREEFNKKQNAEQLYKEYLENKRRQKVAVEKTMAANGGLMPTGIMRANKAGTIERDYRETGGFVPVGIKEKADDVPAMLSKNEFVMTADAVRGMGGGNIEKGAQRLYDQMKTMEKRVV